MKDANEWARMASDKIWNAGAKMTHSELDEIIRPFFFQAIKEAVEEERERIAKMMRDEVIKYVQEAVKNPRSDNYIYAENIPLNRLDKIINLIKEDEKNNL